MNLKKQMKNERARFFKIKHLKIQTNLSRMFFCEKTTKTRMNAVAIRSNDVQREQR